MHLISGIYNYNFVCVDTNAYSLSATPACCFTVSASLTLINHRMKQECRKQYCFLVASQFTVQRSQAKIHLRKEESSCSIQDTAQVRNHMHDWLGSLPEFCTTGFSSQEACLMWDLIRQVQGRGDGVLT